MFPLHFPYRASPCAIRFQLYRTLYFSGIKPLGSQDNHSLPCTTENKHMFDILPPQTHDFLQGTTLPLASLHDTVTHCFIKKTNFNLLKPTGYVMHQQFNIQQLYALPTLCFVFIWEQTATCATYSINWLGFVTEMKGVYSAVRTGSLNKAASASSVKGFVPLVYIKRLSNS